MLEGIIEVNVKDFTVKWSFPIFMCSVFIRFDAGKHVRLVTEWIHKSGIFQIEV